MSTCPEMLLEVMNTSQREPQLILHCLIDRGQVRPSHFFLVMAKGVHMDSLTIINLAHSSEFIWGTLVARMLEVSTLLAFKFCLPWLP